MANNGLWIACAIWLLPTMVCSAQDDMLTPSATQWETGPLTKGKDISGIACIQVNAIRRCIIAVDEAFSALSVKLEGTKITQEELVELAPEAANEEVDAEGVAFDPDGGFFYVIGSHGKKRHCCESNRSAFLLVRFSLDPATGKPSAEIKSSKPLEPALRKSSQIGKHVGECLGTKPTKKQMEKHCTVERKQGANIEGIAIRGKQLFVGFRGPVDGDTAYLMRFDRDALFDDALFDREPVGVTIPVKLGKNGESGIGIRDLAAVKSGLLILSGPEDDDPGRAALHHFEPDSNTLMRLGTLPDISEDAKPEALLVLEDSGSSYRVLILSDGEKGGKPTEFSLKRGS